MNYFDIVRKDFTHKLPIGMRVLNWFRKRVGKEELLVGGFYRNQLWRKFTGVYLGAFKALETNPEINDMIVIEFMTDVIIHEYIHEITKETNIHDEWVEWLTQFPITQMRSKYLTGQETVAFGMMRDKLNAMRTMSQHRMVAPEVREKVSNAYKETLRKVKNEEIQIDDWLDEHGVPPNTKMFRFKQMQDTIKRINTSTDASVSKWDITDLNSSWFDTFKILKQGKLLTLPKTQLRIKKPEKGETDDTCNRKLEEYANKVKGLTMHFRDYWESGGKDSQWAEYLELNSNTKNQYGEHFEVGVSILKDSVTEPIEWGKVGWGFIEGKVWEYRKVPEEVACAALDLLKEISSSMGVLKNKKTIDVGKWKIRCSSYESIMHSSLKLVIIGPNLSSGTVSSVLVDIDAYVIADVSAFKNVKRFSQWVKVYEEFNYPKWREQINWAK